MKKEDIDLDAIKTNLNDGLTNEEVSFRVSQNLVNKQVKVKTKSHFKIIFESFFNLFNVVLYVVMLIMILCAVIFPNGRKDIPITKFGFIFVILFNAITSIISQEISKKTVNKMKLIVDEKVLVLRNKEETLINIEEIVLDDVVILKSGNEVPCDIINMQYEVYVNESMLTGESKNILKKKGDILYSGSYIVSGNTKGIAYKVGSETYVSSMQNKINTIKRKKSQLNEDINKIIKLLLCVIFPLVVATFIKTYYIGENGVHWVFSLNVVTKCAAITVGMIPIGMILLTTITLAESIVKLYKKNTMIQELYAIENLSRVDTLCLDKTGTLTTQNFKVKEVIKLNNEEDINKIMSTFVHFDKDKNKTMEALSNYFKDDSCLEIKEFIPFSSESKFTKIVENSKVFYQIGAFDYILHDKKNIEKAKEYSSLGYRVLALVSNDKDLAIIILEDELRKGINETLKIFYDGGVDIKVISGDNVLTIKEVCKKAGIKDYDKYISLENVEISELKNIYDKYTIFGRTSPDQKQEIIRLLQENNHIVGYIGDGVNDTQSLRQANCSVAFKSGADSTKAVSEVILLDDDFSNLPFVLNEGRRVVANIQRSLLLFLTKTFFIGLFAFVSLFTKEGFIIELESIYAYQFVSIALCGCLLSLENNKNEPIKGNFSKTVVKNAFIYGLFMWLSASIILIINGANDSLIVNEVPLITIIITIAGLAILFDICRPIRTYTLIVFLIGVAGCLLLLVSFPDVFLNPDYLKSTADHQIAHVFDDLFKLDIYKNFKVLEITLIYVYVLLCYPFLLLVKYLTKLFNKLIYKIRNRKKLNSSDNI